MRSSLAVVDRPPLKHVLSAHDLTPGDSPVDDLSVTLREAATRAIASTIPNRRHS